MLNEAKSDGLYFPIPLLNGNIGLQMCNAFVSWKTNFISFNFKLKDER